jgi:outer membrane protein assembly factor BamB
MTHDRFTGEPQHLYQSPSGVPTNPAGVPEAPITAAQAPPPPAPAAPRRRRTGLLIAAIAVVLLLLGAGVAVVVSRLAGGDEQHGLSLAWQLDYPGERSFTDTDTERLYASWLVGDLIIRAQSDGVIAYRVADGSQAWGLPAPDGKTVCTATLNAEKDLAAIAYGTTKSCGTVSGVNLRTGEQTFEATIPAEQVAGRFKVYAPLVSTVSDNVVALTENTLTAFRLVDGGKQWTRPAKRSCYYLNHMAANAGTVLFVENCLGGEPHLVSLDAATGTPKWQTPYPRSNLLTDIISASPAVVSVSAPAGSVLASYDAKGAKAADIPMKDGGVELLDMAIGINAGSRTGQSRYPMTTVGNVLYVRTTESRSGAVNNQLVAIDLSTGKRLWASTGHSDAAFHIIRADAQGVLGFEPGGYATKPQLVRVASDTGKVTVIATGDRAEELEMPSAVDVHETGDAVLILPLEQTQYKHAILALKMS